MRVLHIHSGNLYGGVETLLATLARTGAACPSMESQFALCFDERLAGELRDAGARVHALGRARVRSPLGLRRARLALGDLLRRERFDVAVCHSAWSQAVLGPAVRASGVPLVLWLHAATDGRHWLERWARRTPPRAVVCNSRFTAAALPRLYKDVRAEVVHCPVAPPPGVSPGERARVRAELDTPASSTVIIQVSRMERWKGHEAHLDALKVSEGAGDWVCWFVGGAQRPAEVEYVRALRERADRLGIAARVRFVGQRADVPRLLAAADIFCQPNTEPEPFGLVFVEALRSRLPVVTTDLGGAREIVEKSCGVLVPRGDTAALGGALRTLVENPSLRARLGGRGPERARKLCDPTTQLARLHEVLEGCMRKVTVTA
ncbi:MAG: glycosyltransferase family 4 protein [Pyrinomonadaceae bacterium]